MSAIYAISVKTGDNGRDASALYDDLKLMGHIYSAPYVLLEPDLAIVVEHKDQVVGYVVGTRNTQSWETRLERQWWPALRDQYEAPNPADHDNWTIDQMRIDRMHSPRLINREISERYPAHLHMNLLPSMQRRGIGTALLHKWLSIAIKDGDRGVHVGANPKNTDGIAFWQKSGFETIRTGPKKTPQAGWLGRSSMKTV
ncbi:MAG: GNAT family N-acetyltransferase [Lentilitoribacter sp.]